MISRKQSMSKISRPYDLDKSRLALGFSAFCKSCGYTISEKWWNGSHKSRQRIYQLQEYIPKWNKLSRVERDYHAWKEILIMDEHKDMLLQYLLNLDMKGLIAFCRKVGLTPDDWLLRLGISLTSPSQSERLITMVIYDKCSIPPTLNKKRPINNWIINESSYEAALTENKHIILVDIAMSLAPMLLSVDVVLWISEHVVPGISLFKRRAVICRICDPFLKGTRRKN